MQLSAPVPASTRVAAPPELDVQTLLHVLVDCKGNPKLAIDRIRGLGLEPPSLAEMVEVLKDHLPDLKHRMEVVAQLELFSMMPLLNKTLMENLSALEAGEAVTAYMKLMDLITKSVSSNEVNLNINDQRFNMMPRKLQQAFAALESAGKLDTLLVIDHDPEDQVA